MTAFEVSASHHAALVDLAAGRAGKGRVECGAVAQAETLLGAGADLDAVVHSVELGGDEVVHMPVVVPVARPEHERGHGNVTKPAVVVVDSLDDRHGRCARVRARAAQLERARADVDRLGREAEQRVPGHRRGVDMEAPQVRHGFVGEAISAACSRTRRHQEHHHSHECNAYQWPTKHDSPSVESTTT